MHVEEGRVKTIILEDVSMLNNIKQNDSKRL